MKFVQRNWPIFLVLAVLGVIALGGLLKQHFTGPSDHCSKSATSRPSADVVRTVNEERSNYDMPDNDDKEIMTRKVVPGVEAVAYVRFDTEACGFTVPNVFYYRLTDGMTEADLPSDYGQEASLDVIRVYDAGGVLLNGTNPEACVSDTVPGAKIVDGGITITLVCNRPRPTQESTEPAQ